MLVMACVDYSLGTGTQTSLHAGLIVLVLLCTLWIAINALRHHVVFVRSALNRPLIGLMAAAGVALLAGEAFRPLELQRPGNVLSVELGGLGTFWLGPMALWLFGNTVESVAWLRRVTWLAIALGVLALANAYCVPDHYFFNGVSGIFPTWAVAFAFSQALSNRTLSLPVRAGLLGSVGWWFHWAMFSGTNYKWVSGWLPPLVAVFAVAFARSRRLFIALCLMAFLLFVWNPTFVLERTIYDPTSAQGNMARPVLWRAVIEIANRQPLFGVGLADYKYYMLALNKYLPGDYQVSQAHNSNSHNNYIDIYAQTGLLGLVCFLWFLVAACVVSWRWVGCYREGFLGGYTAGLWGGLAGVMAAMMLGDWFLPFVYNIGLNGFRHALFSWLFLGGLISLGRLAPGRRYGT